MNRGNWWMLLLGSFYFLPVSAKADVPANGKHPILNEAGLAAFIDAEIAKQWKANNVTPAPIAGDAEFVRRLHLDIAGRIPYVSDARGFLEKPSSEKRAEEIEKLLDGPLYVTNFINVWRALMIPKRSDFRANLYNTNFERWLSDKVRNNTGYDKMVREILTAPLGNVRGGLYAGGANGNLAAAFYQANQLKEENLAAATSRIFLGVRLECAQCHDHPFSTWSRNQFWEYTAFFSKIRNPRSNVNFPQANANIISVNLPVMKIPGTKREVNARFLDGKIPQWNRPRDPREVLADWIASPKNPYFAKTAVNRLWGHFFGVGLNDPVDDEPTKENPISHPKLLDELARQFIAHKFDVKYIIRAITLSKTYQRSSALTHESQKNPRVFARMSVRGMTAEQLWESVARATGYREQATTQQRFGVNQNTAKGRFLSRFESTDRATEQETSILQALSQMNGAFVADATSVENSNRLGALQTPFFDTKQRIEILYLGTLTRFPRPDELKRLTAYVDGGGPRQAPNAALADVFWALLNSSEFMLNH